MTKQKIRTQKNFLVGGTLATRRRGQPYKYFLFLCLNWLQVSEKETQVCGNRWRFPSVKRRQVLPSGAITLLNFSTRYALPFVTLLNLSRKKRFIHLILHRLTAGKFSKEFTFFREWKKAVKNFSIFRHVPMLSIKSSDLIKDLMIRMMSITQTCLLLSHALLRYSNQKGESQQLY